MPEACGSTTPSIIWTATAASIAVPPRAQHFEARLDRQRMGGRHHLLRLRARRLDPAGNQQGQEGRERPQPITRGAPR